MYPGLVISHQFAAPSAVGGRLARHAGLWSLREPRVPEWLAPSSCPHMFHWGLGPVLAEFRPSFIRQGLPRFLAESPPELFSFDLGPAARRHAGILPLAPPLGPAAIRRHTAAALKLVRQHYSGPLAAENYNFYPTGFYHRVTEPDFIRDYLEEFGLNLCLDLAHGAVTAHNLGLSPEAYFAALPLERTAEIHISRPWVPSGLLGVDAHEAPEEREWQWLTGVLRSGRVPEAVPVFVEYYRDLGKLEKAQSRLAALLKGDTAE